MIFIGESLSYPFCFLQDPSAEIMPFSHAVNPVLKHIACGLASKNDPPDPPGTGHFYSPSHRLLRQARTGGLFQAGMEDAITRETTQEIMP
ncbi:hypothetical protein LRM35_10660 [Klebsiella variicola subsp. variicola]|nr:hypothetical protein LRM35_10660 [Klebsiella variicola subsp. variicola]